MAVLFSSNSSWDGYTCSIQVVDGRLLYSHNNLKNFSTTSHYRFKPPDTWDYSSQNDTSLAAITITNTTYSLTSEITRTQTEYNYSEETQTASLSWNDFFNETLYQQPTSSIPVGEWFHIVVVADLISKSISFYVNGINVGESLYYPYLSDCYFGRVQIAPVCPSDWRIDDVKFYADGPKLSDSDILSIYNKYTPGGVSIIGSREVGDKLTVRFDSIPPFINPSVLLRLIASADASNGQCQDLSYRNNSLEIGTFLGPVSNFAIFYPLSDVTSSLCMTYDASNWFPAIEGIKLFYQAEAIRYHSQMVSSTGDMLLAKSLIRITIFGTGLVTYPGTDAMVIVKVVPSALVSVSDIELVCLNIDVHHSLNYDSVTDLGPTDDIAQEVSIGNVTLSSSGDFIICYLSTGGTNPKKLNYNYKPILPILSVVTGSHASNWITFQGNEFDWVSSNLVNITKAIASLFETLSFRSIEHLGPPYGWLSDVNSFRFKGFDSLNAASSAMSFFKLKLSTELEVLTTILNHSFTNNSYDGLPSEISYSISSIWTSVDFDIVIIKPSGALSTYNKDVVKIIFGDLPPQLQDLNQNSNDYCNLAPLDISVLSSTGTGNDSHRYHTAVIKSGMSIQGMRGTVCYSYSENKKFIELHKIKNQPVLPSSVTSTSFDPDPPFANQSFRVSLLGSNLGLPNSNDTLILINNPAGCDSTEGDKYESELLPLRDPYGRIKGRVGEFTIEDPIQSGLRICYYPGDTYNVGGLVEIPQTGNGGFQTIRVVQKPKNMTIITSSSMTYLEASGLISSAVLKILLRDNIPNVGATCSISLSMTSDGSSDMSFVGTTKIPMTSSNSFWCDFSSLFGAPITALGEGFIRITVILTDRTQLRRSIPVFVSKPCRPETTCSGHGSCLVDGNCSCSASQRTGFWGGKTCSQCATNYYGSGCSVYCTPETCNRNGICDTITGSCTCFGNTVGSFCDKCSPNRRGYPSCQECTTNWYGFMCDTYCNSNTTCGGRGTCSTDGYCECNSDYWGSWCQLDPRVVPKQSPIRPQCHLEELSLSSSTITLERTSVVLQFSKIIINNKVGCDYLLDAISSSKGSNRTSSLDCLWRSDSVLSLTFHNKTHLWSPGDELILRNMSFITFESGCSLNQSIVVLTSPVQFPELLFSVSHPASVSTCQEYVTLQANIVGIPQGIVSGFEWSLIQQFGYVTGTTQLHNELASSNTSTVVLRNVKLSSAGNYKFGCQLTDVWDRRTFSSNVIIIKKRSELEELPAPFPGAALRIPLFEEMTSGGDIVIPVELNIPNCLKKNLKKSASSVLQYSFRWTISTSLQTFINLSPLTDNFLTHRAYATLFAPAGFLSPVFSPFTVTVNIESKSSMRAVESVSSVINVLPSPLVLKTFGGGQQYYGSEGLLSSACIDPEILLANNSYPAARIPRSKTRMLWGCATDNSSIAVPGQRCSLIGRSSLITRVSLRLLSDATPGLYSFVVFCSVTWISEVVPFSRNISKHLWVEILPPKVSDRGIDKLQNQESQLPSFDVTIVADEISNPHPYTSVIPELLVKLLVGSDHYSAILSSTNTSVISPKHLVDEQVLQPDTAYTIASTYELEISVNSFDYNVVKTLYIHLQTTNSLGSESAKIIIENEKIFNSFDEMYVTTVGWNTPATSLKYKFEIISEVGLVTSVTMFQSGNQKLITIPMVSNIETLVIRVWATDGFGTLEHITKTIIISGGSELMYLPMAKDLYTYRKNLDPFDYLSSVRDFSKKFVEDAFQNDNNNVSTITQLLTLFPRSGLDRTSSERLVAASALQNLFNDLIQSGEVIEMSFSEYTNIVEITSAVVQRRLFTNGQRGIAPLTIDPNTGSSLINILQFITSPGLMTTEGHLKLLESILSGIALALHESNTKSDLCHCSSGYQSFLAVQYNTIVFNQLQQPDSRPFVKSSSFKNDKKITACHFKWNRDIFGDWLRVSSRENNPLSNSNIETVLISDKGELELTHQSNTTYKILVMVTSPPGIITEEDIRCAQWDSSIGDMITSTCQIQSYSVVGVLCECDLKSETEIIHITTLKTLLVTDPPTPLPTVKSTEIPETESPGDPDSVFGIITYSIAVLALSCISLLRFRKDLKSTDKLFISDRDLLSTDASCRLAYEKRLKGPQASQSPTEVAEYLVSRPKAINEDAEMYIRAVQMINYNIWLRLLKTSFTKYNFQSSLKYTNISSFERMFIISTLLLVAPFTAALLSSENAVHKIIVGSISNSILVFLIGRMLLLVAVRVPKKKPINQPDVSYNVNDVEQSPRSAISSPRSVHSKKSVAFSQGSGGSVLMSPSSMSKLRRKSSKRLMRSLSAVDDRYKLTLDDLDNIFFDEVRDGRVHAAVAIELTKEAVGRGFLKYTDEDGNSLPNDFFSISVTTAIEKTEELFSQTFSDLSCDDQQSMLPDDIDGPFTSPFTSLWNYEETTSLWKLAIHLCEQRQILIAPVVFQLALLSDSPDLFFIFNIGDCPSNQDEVIHDIIHSEFNVGIHFTMMVYQSVHDVRIERFVNEYHRAMENGKPSIEEITAITMLNWGRLRPCDFDDVLKSKFDSKSDKNLGLDDLKSLARRDDSILTAVHTIQKQQPGIALEIARANLLEYFDSSERDHLCRRILSEEVHIIDECHRKLRYFPEPTKSLSDSRSEWLCYSLNFKSTGIKGIIFTTPQRINIPDYIQSTNFPFFSLTQMSRNVGVGFGSGTEKNPFQGIPIAMFNAREGETVALLSGNYPVLELSLVTPYDELGDSCLKKQVVTEFRRAPTASPEDVSIKGIIVEHCSNIMISGVHVGKGVVSTHSKGIIVDNCSFDESSAGHICASVDCCESSTGSVLSRSNFITRSLSYFIISSVFSILIISTTLMIITFSYLKSWEWILSSIVCLTVDFFFLQPLMSYAVMSVVRVHRSRRRVI